MTTLGDVYLHVRKRMQTAYLATEAARNIRIPNGNIGILRLENEEIEFLTLRIYGLYRDVRVPFLQQRFCSGDTDDELILATHRVYLCISESTLGDCPGGV